MIHDKIRQLIHEARIQRIEPQLIVLCSNDWNELRSGILGSYTSVFDHVSISATIELSQDARLYGIKTITSELAKETMAL